VSEGSGYELVRTIGAGRTVAVFTADFPSIEAARAGAIERAAGSMPWLSEGEQANAVVPLQTLTVGRTVKISETRYAIRAR
jgi:hypothetical protein